MELPNLDNISLDELDSLYNKASEINIDDSKWESIIETYPEEIDKLINDHESYSKSVLRDKLTKKELDQIPFPYKTTATRSRATEIVNWLDDHKSFKTMDIKLLRQRIFNHFVIKIHDIPHYEQENISSMANRLFERRRKFLRSKKWINIRE